MQENFEFKWSGGEKNKESNRENDGGDVKKSENMSQKKLAETMNFKKESKKNSGQQLFNFLIGLNHCTVARTEYIFFCRGFT